MKRRSILAGCSALALAGCAGLSPAQIARQAVTDLGLIANGFAAGTPELASITGISAATLTSVSALFGKAQALAAGISATVTAETAKPVVQQIEAYFGEALTLLGDLLLPPPFSTVLTALNVLLPVVEAAVGLPVPVGAALGGMTPAQARAVLASA